MCFPINSSANQLTQEQIPFHFSSESFHYVGINITHSFQGLHKHNFDKLLNKVKADLQKWSKLPIVISRQSANYKNECLAEIFVSFSVPSFLSDETFFKHSSICMGRQDTKNKEKHSAGSKTGGWTGPA